MKRIIIAAVTAIIAFQPHAHASITQNGANITISGKLEVPRGSYISFMLTAEGDENRRVLAGNQIFSEDGAYSFTQNPKLSPGWYTARTASEFSLSAYEERFFYASLSDLSSITDSLNGITEPSAADALFTASNAELLGADLNALNGITDKNLVYAYILSKKPYSAEESSKIAETFRNGAVLALINQARSSAEVKSVMDGAANWLDTFLNDEAVNGIFAGVVKAEGKNAVYEYVKGAPATEEGLRARWGEAVALAAFNYPRNGRFDMPVVISGGGLAAGLNSADVSLYLSFDGERKLAVENAVYGKGFANIEAARAAFSSAVAGANTSNPVNPGGGGNGGGIRSTVVPSPVKEETPEGSQTAEENEVFSDLNGFEWAREAIETLYGAGVVNGVEPKIFAPGNRITREEFVKLSVMAFGLYDAVAVAEFYDVSEGDWFYPYVASGSSRGIVNGVGGGRFGTGEFITRQDTAVLIYRAAQISGIAFPRGNAVIFPDGGDISEYACGAVDALSGGGIISGTGIGFEPRGFATRAEAAKLIYGAVLLQPPHKLAGGLK